MIRVLVGEYYEVFTSGGTYHGHMGSWISSDLIPGVRNVVNGDMNSLCENSTYLSGSGSERG